MKRLYQITSAAFLLCAVAANAQTSFPMLGSTYPAGAERGKTSEITLYGGGNGGANLNGAYKVLVEGKGVTAEVIVPEKGYPAPDPKTPWALPHVGEIKLRVTVAPDAPLGTREFRIATQRAGISSLAQLTISDEMELTEKEGNNTLKEAQTVALPCTVNGRFQQSEDVDYFKFKAEAGQEVTFAVLGSRLQDKVHDLQEHSDPLLVLMDANGVEIARNDDYYRADPLLSHKFEKAGEYTVQIRDVSYKGNPHWVYRLGMTSRPYVTQTVPCAVRAGQTAELRIGGFHLGGTQTARLEVPTDAPRGIWYAQLKLANGTTNPIPLLVTDLPQTARDPQPAKTGNQAGAKSPVPPPAPLALPGGVSSWMRQDGQIDRYSIRVKKGEVWSFETTSRRLDSTMDTEIKIRDMQGNVYTANDDFNSVKDSRLEWTAPSDAEFVVEVRDLANRYGDTCFYNLTAERLSQNFTLKCDTDRMMLAPGNRTSWYVMVERKHGFAGEVKVEVKGLPAGLSVTPLVIPANMTTGTLLFTAAPDAKRDASLVEIVGTATAVGLDGKPMMLERTTTPVTEIYMPGGGRGLLPVRTQAAAITETNDLEVTANVKELTLKPGSEVKIEITLKRRPDYTKAVTLDARVQHLGGIFVNPLPPGVTLEDATIPENQNKGVVTLRVAADAQPVKEMTLALFANVSINFVMKVWYSAEPIKLTIQK